MKKHYYTWDDMHRAAHSIVLQMNRDSWKPDYIVGVVRGGLPLATLISHITDIQLWTINPDGEEVNCWMADDAFGYNDPEVTGITGSRWDPKLRKNILVVDNINNTGSQFEWIKKDWQGSCFPNEEHAWEAVWRNNVRFAVMTDNTGSDFETHYHWHSIDKTDTWCVYPYEYELQV